VPGDKTTVLVAAGNAGWEVEALRLLGSPTSGAVVLKRCVDLPDLLASAATGQAGVAVVAGELAGLDTDSVSRLHRSGVSVVLVDDGRAGGGLGADAVTSPRSVEDLVAAVAAAARSTTAEAGAPSVEPEQDGTEVPTAPTGDREGRVVAVWGPTGAPGRTTLAVGIAAELAARGSDTLLVDADSYGGAVAQHLGVLDEVSGLLSAVRLAGSGRLDTGRLAEVARTVSPGLRVLTGLPRADRWVEVRAPAFDTVLETARRLCAHVVLDLGFGLEQDTLAAASGAPHRNQMTLAGLDVADEVVAVGSADPVGLTRLARGLLELREEVPVATTHVVVNQMRPSVGWGQSEVRAMIEQLGVPATTRFVPADRDTADRALALGSPLTELGETPLRAAVAEVVDGLRDVPLEASPPRGRRRLRRRRASTAR
jgi:MinD-like ATPase involved in chromosome partitioning or flagellar assembly